MRHQGGWIQRLLRSGSDHAGVLLGCAVAAGLLSLPALVFGADVAPAAPTEYRDVPYVGSRNVIWVVGTQKITPTLEDAVRRVREYVLPLEDQRQKSIGNQAGSRINRLLILEGEPAYLRRNLRLILINQALGF